MPDLLEQGAVPGDGDLATRLPDDVIASSPAHGVEIVLAVPGRADRRGDGARVARRDDDAAADVADEAGGLALVVCRGDHRPAGGQVLVEVADDGAGIDLHAVGTGALARGLVTDGQLAEMTAGELRQLVFQPGLSTAVEVTRLSGRGVGMDVVKTNVESVGGSVEIDSEPGRGTTCRLRLPRTATGRVFT